MKTAKILTFVLRKNKRMMLRAAELNDVSAIAEVQVKGWQQAYHGIVPQSYLDAMDVEERADLWERHVAAKKMTIMVAEKEGEILGFATMGPCNDERFPFYTRELFTLYVHPSHQRKGIGRKLFESMLGTVKRQPMLLWSFTDNPNVGFYKAMGGKKLDTQMQEFNGKQVEETAYGWG